MAEFDGLVAVVTGSASGIGAATAALLAERGRAPLLLLDDVLSELDPGRRRVLAERVATRGRTLITSTSVAALPVRPDQLIEVSPGEARRR